MLGYADEVDMDVISAPVLQILKDDGIHRDVFLNLKTAFDDGEADFFVHAVYLKQLIQSVVPLMPTAHFEVRCLGEEFRHTWIATYKDGQEIFSQGPWDYDKD